ncbi:TetR/AcrR family transcriptional regulator [Actinoplanes sp. NPDC051494]|uniref:TetR/AcrR family transcriptional regulator n=1 Tax=Actinoplanes sp. NPDC051494 TaxID=3363907 RepID=UPI0037AB79CC
MGTRDVIIDAAAAVIRDRGLAAATTRQIAARAGFSEATLYKHFADKVELMLAVLQERSPGQADLGAALADADGDLEDRLTAIAQALIVFFSDNVPMLASVFSDRTILRGHTEGLRKHGGGPHHVNEALMTFLQRESTAGRIAADADLYAAAALFAGACMQHAFLGHLGWDARRDDGAAARSFARTLLAGLSG